MKINKFLESIKYKKRGMYILDKGTVFSDKKKKGAQNVDYVVISN